MTGPARRSHTGSNGGNAGRGEGCRQIHFQIADPGGPGRGVQGEDQHAALDRGFEAVGTGADRKARPDFSQQAFIATQLLEMPGDPLDRVKELLDVCRTLAHGMDCSPVEESEAATAVGLNHNCNW